MRAARATRAEFKNLSRAADARGEIAYNDFALFEIVNSEPASFAAQDAWRQRWCRQPGPDPDRKKAACKFRGTDAEPRAGRSSPRPDPDRIKTGCAQANENQAFIAET